MQGFLPSPSAPSKIPPFKKQVKMSGATTFATYDAATKIYTPQTREEFAASLVADIQRALDSGVLDEKPMNLREIQAEEAKASAAAAAKQARVAREKAAAEAAWDADRASHDAAGRKPCWVCARYAKEVHYHAPKQGSCPLTGELFYVHDRWGQPHTAYVRRDEMAALQERKQREAAAAAAAAQEAAKKSELGGLIDAALSAAAMSAAAMSAAAMSAAKKPSSGAAGGAAKKAKKETVKKFSLDEI
jgi:hypothetical protein